MKNRILLIALVAVLSLPFSSQPVYAYDSSEIEQFLSANRTLNGNPYRTSGGENVDQPFMIDLIQEEIANFNNLMDDYDDPGNPPTSIGPLRGARRVMRTSQEALLSTRNAVLPI